MVMRKLAVRPECRCMREINTVLKAIIIISGATNKACHSLKYGVIDWSIFSQYEYKEDIYPQIECYWESLWRGKENAKKKSSKINDNVFSAACGLDLCNN